MALLDLAAEGQKLRQLSSKNVLLGKNGCGKSHILKALDRQYRTQKEWGTVRYISPERGGQLSYKTNIEQAMLDNEHWLADARSKNQAADFRQQSTALFRQLELRVLRAIEEDHTKEGYQPTTFASTVEQLNTLLDRVRIIRDTQKAFRIVIKETGVECTPDSVSSGEAELISLGIEVLVFARACEVGKANVLLIDEPDVHLHPDLQDRLARFVLEVTKDKPLTLVVATHSTALLAALAQDDDTRVCFMKRGMQELSFVPVTDVDRKILPIFGAHPLSNVFNSSPVLLVEGEDDVRVWQQVVRSSQNRIQLFPCEVEGKSSFKEFEAEVNGIIASVYDDAVAFSLRDRDDDPETINDLDHVKRMRLSCRAAENLMLANETLAGVGKTWDEFKVDIGLWIRANRMHPFYQQMLDFSKSIDRKGHDLKEVRNVLAGMLTNKPWEVLVGQTIAKLSSSSLVADGSMRDFLGNRVCTELLKFS